MRGRLCALWLSLGCTTGNGAVDAGPGDARLRDEGVREDAAIADAEARDEGTRQDSGVADTGAADGATITRYGFTIRDPARHTIPCDSMFCGGTTIEATDIDHVCTLDHGAERAKYVYVAADPVELRGFAGTTYRVHAAFISDGTTAEMVPGTYEYGGNHHNDAFTITRPDKLYRYYHSSFGFGFRKCQPADCVQVYSPGGDLEEDGCTSERTIPVTCVRVGAGPVVPPLVDEFMKCPGDD